MSELVDDADSKSVAKACEFESHREHQQEYCFSFKGIVQRFLSCNLVDSDDEFQAVVIMDSKRISISYTQDIGDLTCKKKSHNVVVVQLARHTELKILHD